MAILTSRKHSTIPGYMSYFVRPNINDVRKARVDRSKEQIANCSAGLVQNQCKNSGGVYNKQMLHGSRREICRFAMFQKYEI